MAAGQYALLAGVLVVVFVAGMAMQYVRDSLRCDRRHHDETHPLNG